MPCRGACTGVVPVQGPSCAGGGWAGAGGCLRLRCSLSEVRGPDSGFSQAPDHVYVSWGAVPGAWPRMATLSVTPWSPGRPCLHMAFSGQLQAGPTSFAVSGTQWLRCPQQGCGGGGTFPS